MMPRRRVSRASQGFTVIEVMIASAILVIGFAAIIALLGQSNSVHRHSIDSSRASMLADEIFEDITLAYDVRWADVRPKNGAPDLFEKAAVNGRVSVHAELPSENGFSYSVNFVSRRTSYPPMPSAARRADLADQRELLVVVDIYWIEAGAERNLNAKRVIRIGGVSAQAP